jgi:Ca2+-binding RTX toxin-like protein
MKAATLIGTWLVSLSWAGGALGGTATFSARHLVYTANPGEVNHTLVQEGGLGFEVTDTTAPVTAGQGCAVVNANEVFCAKTNNKKVQIRVLAGDMDDVIEVRAGTYRRADLHGGAGGDVLQGGEKVNVLHGGPGADVFRGRPDSFVNRPHDVVDYSSRAAPVSVTLSDGVANEGEAGENDQIEKGIDEVDGGHASDTMSDDNRRFVLLYGKQGDDRVNGGVAFGGGGRDTLICPRGLCEFSGGPGDDVLRGAGSFDELEGNGGDDKLVGRAGGDLMWGGAGNDLIDAGRSNDFVNGGKGADEIFGGPGRDNLLGTSGPDAFSARDGDIDRLNGGPGRDRAEVDSALDRLKRIEVVT